MDTGTVLGLIGVGLCLASFAAKRMVPLRVLAMAGNVSLIAYGYVESQLPSLVLNATTVSLIDPMFNDVVVLAATYRPRASIARASSRAWR